MTNANMNMKNIDPTNWSQVEQYADDVIAAILETSNGDQALTIDLFRDHIISMVSPDYFEKMENNS